MSCRMNRSWMNSRTWICLGMASKMMMNRSGWVMVLVLMMMHCQVMEIVIKTRMTTTMRFASLSRMLNSSPLSRDLWRSLSNSEILLRILMTLNRYGFFFRCGPLPKPSESSLTISTLAKCSGQAATKRWKVTTSFWCRTSCGLRISSSCIVSRNFASTNTSSQASLKKTS